MKYIIRIANTAFYVAGAHTLGFVATVKATNALHFNSEVAASNFACSLSYESEKDFVITFIIYAE